MKTLNDKFVTVYNVCKDILYTKGHKLDKKHGNYYLIYGHKNQVVFMDSWNGHISQAHCSDSIWSNGFTLESKSDISEHTIINCLDYVKCSVEDLENAVYIYKTLLKVI